MRTGLATDTAAHSAFVVVAPASTVGLGLGVVVLLPVGLLVLGLITEGCGPPN